MTTNKKTFGAVAASDAHADLVRSLTENCSTFAREHAESFLGLAADAQAQMQDGRRSARSVLTTYPRHGVMRGNHRLTFAR
ncbi:hypothetical protein [Variovorax sp. YR216]|uniref:hypothetical protein n=1 Tax=Variovorax sp. YR216 TaxID=1882828 RepID=UPI000899C7FA|nr:hypothetical protein [Variovorax sp. YR216]SEB21924.1 hypothetical protein SAMN05444680_11591 [Variovorax sp. YR216]